MGDGPTGRIGPTAQKTVDQASRPGPGINTLKLFVIADLSVEHS